jgi:uncharacterized protein
VLILVAMNDHAARIQTGSGLASRLPDSTAQGIIDDDMVPEFRAGHDTAGIVVGVNAVGADLGPAPSSTLSALSQSATSQPAASPSGHGGITALVWGGIAIVILGGLFVFRRFLPSGLGGGDGTGSGHVYGGGGDAGAGSGGFGGRSSDGGGAAGSW